MILPTREGPLSYSSIAHSHLSSLLLILLPAPTLSSMHPVIDIGVSSHSPIIVGHLPVCIMLLPLLLSRQSGLYVGVVALRTSFL